MRERTEGRVEVERIGVAMQGGGEGKAPISYRPSLEKSMSNAPIDLEEPAKQVAGLPQAPDAVEVGVVNVKERVTR